MKAKLMILAASLVAVLLSAFVDNLIGKRLAPLENVTEKAKAAYLAPPMYFAPLGGEQPTHLRAFQGRWVLLNVWASWCAPCVKEFPDLLSLAAEYPHALQFVSLSVDRDAKAAAKFLKRFETSEKAKNVLHAYDANQSISRDLLQIHRYPESLLIGPKGHMQRKFAGALSKEDIEAIRRLVGQR